MPCMAQFTHPCTGWQGCEPAHSDWQLFGRGIGHKTPDWAFAAVCHMAHQAFDRMSREDKRMEWLRAYVATQNHIWENELVKVA